MPDTPYDGKGVFTGCKVPSRDDSLTYVYTSIGALPIHHTLPHIKGSESLSMAKSFDGGKSWEKYAGNPILPSEPEGLDVTGWRDPFVSLWPSMATKLDLDPENTLFGIISGGIREVTPTTFLYAIDADDLTRWQYVGPLVNFGLNLRPSRWSGDLGKNWEVTNFLTLKDQTDPIISRDFLVMGTEGCLPEPDSAENPSEPSIGPSRPIRGQLWMSGSLQHTKQPESSSSSPVQMTYGFGGHLDHGCLYAANSFFDPKTAKHVVWGWITEEDLSDELRHKQGWSGMLSLPREVYLQTTKNTVSASKSALSDITSIEHEQDEHGTYTVRTLASQPVQSVTERLRQKASVRQARTSKSLLRDQDTSDLAFTSEDVTTDAWELDCSFRVEKGCEAIGIQIIHNTQEGKPCPQPKSFPISYSPDPPTADPTTQTPPTTTLTFHPLTETLTLTRPCLPFPNSTAHINITPERAPHTLFTSHNPATGETATEPLRIRAWRDNSALEVFVNERTAISTRLYGAEGGTVGVRFFAEDGSGDDDGSEVLGATLWDGIRV